MAPQIDFLGPARREFDASFDWYAERSHVAAIGFVAAIDEALDRVAADPDRFVRTYAGCQSCRVKRYPYCIVYRCLEAGFRWSP